VLFAMVSAERFLGLSTDQAVTVSFLTLALAQLWHVFNMRETGTGLIRNDITSNPWIWAALGLCLLLIFGATTLPGISEVLSLIALPSAGWGLAVGASFVPLLAGGVIRRLAAGNRSLFGTE
jgi:P-type Ca2+ transporter type 2C